MRLFDKVLIQYCDIKLCIYINKYVILISNKRYIITTAGNSKILKSLIEKRPLIYDYNNNKEDSNRTVQHELWEQGNECQRWQMTF